MVQMQMQMAMQTTAETSTLVSHLAAQHQAGVMPMLQLFYNHMQQNHKALSELAQKVQDMDQRIAMWETYYLPCIIDNIREMGGVGPVNEASASTPQPSMTPIATTPQIIVAADASNEAQPQDHEHAQQQDSPMQPVELNQQEPQQEQQQSEQPFQAVRERSLRACCTKVAHPALKPFRKH